MVERLERAGSLCRCPVFPGCVPDLFVSDRGRDGDLFCPRLAAAITRGDRKE
jgi:hypothetical protein